MVESHILHITESITKWLDPMMVMLVSGEGSLAQYRNDNISRIRIRATQQVVGPFLDVARLDIEASGDVTYLFYDLNNLAEEDLAALTMLPRGTRTWVIDTLGRRNEYYWGGAAWLPVSWTVIGSGAPSDVDGRPDGTIYFQI